MKNIIFTGLPGSGKSTLGKMAADALDMEFIDMDSLIEEKAGMKISQIFKIYGEQYFRDLEASVAEEISRQFTTLVATGGGTILREGNVKALHSNGIIIFLDRDPKIISSNINYDVRPLLDGDPEKLFKLAGERRELYMSVADITVTNNGLLEEDFNILMEAIRKFTKKSSFAVIGDPIGHTLSPVIHNTVFETLNISENYTACHVLKGNLKNFTKYAKTSGLYGFNVTIPHKQDILPFLDMTEEKALLCGSVNTVIIKSNKLYGYNTDISGFIMSLEYDGYNLNGKNIMVLGTGGAALSAAFAAASSSAGKITVLGRDINKAEKIKDNVKKVYNTQIIAECMDTIVKLAADTDILVNATPLGMYGYGEDFPSLEFLKILPKHALVYDLIYNPLETSFLKEANALGLRVKNGLDMLIYQALAADELFVGKQIDKPFLYEKIYNKLLINKE